MELCLGPTIRHHPTGTNPFLNNRSAVGSIWAWGLRNPYTFAFEASVPRPRMFINDVGWDTAEEVNVGVRGANYGWPNSEVRCCGHGGAQGLLSLCTS